MYCERPCHLKWNFCTTPPRDRGNWNISWIVGMPWRANVALKVDNTKCWHLWSLGVCFLEDGKNLTKRSVNKARCDL